MANQLESEWLQQERDVKMTKEEKAAIKLYTGAAYRRINGYLRRLSNGSTEEEAKKKVVLKIMNTKQYL